MFNKIITASEFIIDPPSLAEAVPALCVPVLPEELRNRTNYTSPEALTARQLSFAGNWAIEAFGYLDSDTLRKAISPGLPTEAIDEGLARHYRGSLEELAKHTDGGSIHWPPSLLAGAEAWPRRPKAPRIALPSVLQTYFNPANAAYDLPPAWGDVCSWYHETTPLTKRIGEAVGPIIVDGAAAPLNDWREYWNDGKLPYDLPELRRAKKSLFSSVVSLEGIPHITDPEEVEQALRDEPYLCIAADYRVRRRTGEEVLLLDMEKTALNLLLLFELRTARAVGIARMSRYTNRPAAAFEAALMKLGTKLNVGKSAAVIQDVGRGHWRVSPRTILVDARPGPEPSEA